MEKVIEKYWDMGIEKKMAFGRSRQWTLNGSVWDNNYYGKSAKTTTMTTKTTATTKATAMTTKTTTI